MLAFLLQIFVLEIWFKSGDIYFAFQFYATLLLKVNASLRCASFSALIGAQQSRYAAIVVPLYWNMLQASRLEISVIG